MTIPCAVCFEPHQEIVEIRCACSGEVECAGSEGPKRYNEAREVVWFLVACVTCGRLFSVDSRTGAKAGVQEPVMPGGV